MLIAMQKTDEYCNVYYKVTNSLLEQACSNVTV